MATEWATETARTLVTWYLADEPDFPVEGVIEELVANAAPHQIAELLLIMTTAVGDVFDDLQDFSQNIIEILGGSPQ